MWREQVVTFARALEHPAWGISHCERTYRTAMALAAEERLPAREPVVFAVAYLHDAGAFSPWSDAGLPQPEASAAAAEDVLSRAGYREDWATDVLAVIRAHDFERPPLELPESRCFHDADMLDFLGAIGLTRLLSISGLEEWTPDPRSAVTVARAFAETLPDKMVTRAGGRIALERAMESRTWLGWLDAETEGLAEL